MLYMQLRHLPPPAPTSAYTSVCGRSLEHAPRVAGIEAHVHLLPGDLAQLHPPHSKGRLRPTTPSSASCAKAPPQQYGE
ncbi:hypothetical protein DFH09DRAFT_1320671 [Mycena vulgaris]|nr:hypothetical protein DFH09DRAFT_1320671 [Mycena vulgaris]